jgi:hypothetical protein
MTDDEFDVLDELYFVTSFEALAKQVHLPEQVLKQTLHTCCRGAGSSVLLRLLKSCRPVTSILNRSTGIIIF